MINGPGLAIIIAAALTFYLGSETIKGAKWIGRHVKAGITRLAHPRQPAPLASYHVRFTHGERVEPFGPQTPEEREAFFADIGRP